MTKKAKRWFYTTMDSANIPEWTNHSIKHPHKTHLPLDIPFSEYGCDFCGVGRLERKTRFFNLEDRLLLNYEKHLE